MSLDANVLWQFYQLEEIHDCFIYLFILKSFPPGNYNVHPLPVVKIV